MKDCVLKIINSCLSIFLFLSVQAQINTVGDSTLICLWKKATIENIDCQLLLKETKKEDSFYYKILTTEKEFIKVQSKKDGLRKDFMNEVLKKLDTAPHLLDDAYIVEHYRSGESFSAVINLYSFGVKNKQYIYQLELGQWKLIDIKNFLDSSIKSFFFDKNAYLCDEYYTDESIILTNVHKKLFRTKAFLFPCSKDFKKIKLLIQ